MEDKKPPKLLVSKTEASEKIRDRINIGKELYKVQISSEQEYNNLCHERKKWVDYNKSLFDTLFDKSPLSDWHGYSIAFARILNHNLLQQNIEALKKEIDSGINQLESIHEQLELYEESAKNTEQAMSKDTTNNVNKKILICHGRSSVWREAKDFIVDTLGLEYEEFERISAAGKSINNRLEEMLDKSCMAFLIMTGEDEHTDSSVHARQNVIHEIGKCQERFGLERSIILLEKGCEIFSNMDGIIYINFAKGNIKETFGEIVKVLKRESIIKIELCN